MNPYWRNTMEFTRRQFWSVKIGMFFFILAFLYLAFAAAIRFGYEQGEKKKSMLAPIITYYREGIPVCTDPRGSIFFVAEKKGGFQITGTAIKK